MMISKKEILSVALMVLLSLGTSFGEAAKENVNIVVGDVSVVNVPSDKSQGVVKWGKASNSVIEVVGIGVPNGPGPQGRALAKRAAIVDAYRNLAETAQGVQVDSETTVEQLMVTNDVIKTKVTAFLKGFKVMDEGANPDGTYYVRVQMPLFGTNGLAGAVLPTRMANVETEPLPVAGNAYSGPVAERAYTGVIIDARGFALQPTFAPAVFDDSGRAVYGVHNLNVAYSIKHGMVEYAKGEAMTNNALNGASRAGANPLVIKAIAPKMASNGVTKVSAVISAADADRMLKENARAGFLGNYAVVFVI